jgi:hypothetical protein
MPIRREFRSPAYWPEISHRIRFKRAGGLCQQCARPHKLRCHLTAAGLTQSSIIGVMDEAAQCRPSAELQRAQEKAPLRAGQGAGWISGETYSAINPGSCPTEWRRSCG